jgi:hypothetical protein
MTKPLYKHDCPACKFLGQDDTGTQDIYFCPQGGFDPTIIARFSDEDSNYTSGIVFAGHVPAIALGVKRATKLGLLPEEV